MDHGCGISWERGLDEGGQVLSRGRGSSKEKSWKFGKKISITRRVYLRLSFNGSIERDRAILLGPVKRFSSSERTSNKGNLRIYFSHAFQSFCLL